MLSLKHFGQLLLSLNKNTIQKEKSRTLNSVTHFLFTNH